MAVGHYENFPVASLLLPAPLRQPVEAIYRFARSADDLADEGCDPAEVRLARLDAYRAELARIEHSQPVREPAFLALEKTIKDHALPMGPFRDLLDAFSQDVTKKRYADYTELLDYCRRSANPVGRLVLLVFEQDRPELPPLSDAICTALQLANHWQDVAIDLRKDRIYLPRELRDRFAVPEWDLNAGRVTEGFRALMREVLGRTRALFAQGRPLCDLVGRELRFEMRLTWLGGSTILDRIEAVSYDVFRRRPHHGPLAKALMAWRAWRWRGLLAERSP